MKVHRNLGGRRSGKQNGPRLVVSSLGPECGTAYAFGVCPEFPLIQECAGRGAVLGLRREGLVILQPGWGRCRGGTGESFRQDRWHGRRGFGGLRRLLQRRANTPRQVARSGWRIRRFRRNRCAISMPVATPAFQAAEERDRKSTRLNSSHLGISYA